VVSGKLLLALVLALLLLPASLSSAVTAPSPYCVWLLSYLHFCVAEPAKPPLHKNAILWQVSNTDETLQGANNYGQWCMGLGQVDLGSLLSKV
jgi:hypothetical protein